MSLTKENPAFDRMMEELRMEADQDHDRFMEWTFLVDREKEKETINPAKATTTKEG